MIIIDDREQVSRELAVIVCTFREMHPDEAVDEVPEKGSRYSPVTLADGEQRGTLRPWNPHTCAIGAAIHNRFIHMTTVRPGVSMFIIGFSLQTTSHIADIIGPNGHVFWVVGDDTGTRKPEERKLSALLRMYPWVTVVQSDPKTATLESYEHLLSMPLANKFAFLMALHPRLGEQSPANKLAIAPVQILQEIFSFIECPHVAKVKCLFVSDWPLDNYIEKVSEVVLSHIRIFRQWRTPKKPLAASPTPLHGWKGHGGFSTRQQCRRVMVSSAATAEGADGYSHRIPVSSYHPEMLDVFLHIPLADIKVGRSFKRSQSGSRTGLKPVESLRLEPYFPHHQLLLLQYNPKRDPHTAKAGGSKVPQPPVPSQKHGGSIRGSAEAEEGSGSNSFG